MATYPDVCFFIIHDWEHIGYQQNTVKSSGKGPNLLAQKFKMNKTEKNYIKQCVNRLKKETTDNEDGRKCRIFCSNKKAKHRVLKHNNLNNPTQKKKKRNSKKQVEEKKVQESKQMKCKREPSTSMR